MTTSTKAFLKWAQDNNRPIQDAAGYFENIEAELLAELFRDRAAQVRNLTKGE